MRMRKLLRDGGHKRYSPVTWAAMTFLNLTDPASIKLMRKLMIDWGYRGQRLAAGLARRLRRGGSGRLPEATNTPMRMHSQVVHFVARPMPASVPRQTLRATLGLEDTALVPILRDPEKPAEEMEAVFYFPGCGSERLFSQIGLATLAMLYETGAQTVLPPGYLCCGYPQTSAGLAAKGQQITTENRVLFHRVANTLNYMDIRTVVVSCGTCMDQLLEYEFDRIFPGCRLLDIHEYLMEKDVGIDGLQGVQYLYHDPCHSPMKQHDPIQVATDLLGQPVTLSDRCCGEAGTLGTARPDIANQLRFRKVEELRKGIETLTGHQETAGQVKLLTSCPACQQGLARYGDETGIKTDYIVVEMARHLLGAGWQDAFVDKAKAGGIERVLL